MGPGYPCFSGIAGDSSWKRFCVIQGGQFVGLRTWHRYWFGLEADLKIWS